MEGIEFNGTPLLFILLGVTGPGPTAHVAAIIYKIGTE